MDFLFTLICGAIGGFVLYLLDRSRGPKWFKSWYDLTHKTPMESLPANGFVHGRPISAKVYAAIAIAAVGGIVLFALGLSHPLTSLIGALGLLAGLIISFVLAPLALKLDTNQVKEVIAKLDDLEERPAQAEKKTEAPAPKPAEKPAAVPDPKAPETEAKDTPKKDDDWRGGVKKFLDN